MYAKLLHDDCKVRMALMGASTIDAVISDPPYYLTSVKRGSQPDGKLARGFMGRTWDGDGLAHSKEFWDIVFRVLTPGGVVKAFGGTRTFHRMGEAMEAAGFVDIHLEAWLYASGFPKSLDVGKSIDKMKGAVRTPKRIPFSGEALMRHGGENTRPWMEAALKNGYHELPGDEPATPEAALWDGWGTALKPAWEPILVGRKPA